MTLVETEKSQPDNQIPAASRFHPKFRTFWGSRVLRGWYHFFVNIIAITLNWLLGTRANNSFGILTYHRISDPIPGLSLPTYNVAPQKFREQLSGLLSRGFKPWPLDRIHNYSREGKPIPQGVFAVTFDDGYANFFENAWPILCELQIPATIFLPTAYLDSTEPFPFDDWDSAGSAAVPLSSWTPLTAVQCQEMLASGWVTFGSHTHRHEDFRGREDDFAIDIAESIEQLQTKFGLENVPFAFPYGIASDEMQEVVRRLKLPIALTCRAELTNAESDTLSWGRFDVSSDASVSQLSACLSGWNSAVRRPLQWLMQGGRRLTALFFDANLQHGVVSLVDQAVVSVTNFVTNVIIGKWSKSELGLYLLAFRVLLFIRTMQDQIISTPYTIYSARHQGKSLRIFTGSTLVHQLGVSLFSLVCLFLMVVVLSMGWGPVEVLPALQSLILVLPFLLFREYLRQISLARLQVRTALIIDSITAAMYISGLLLLWHFEFISVGHAYIMLGLSCITACLWWFLSRPSPFHFDRGRMLSDWNSNWNFGKWTYSSELLSSGTNLLLPLILTVMHSKEAAGTFAASLTPVGLANLFATGVLSVLLPQAVQALSSGGTAELRKVLRKYAILLFLVMGSFSLLMATAGGWVTVTIFNSKYADCMPVPAILSLVFLVGSLGATASCGILAVERPRTNLKTESCIFCVTLTLAFLLIPSQGAVGAALAMLAGTTSGVIIRISAFFYWLRALEKMEASRAP